MMNFKLKLLQHFFRSKTEGLTIIESLLAIIVVALLIVAIGPILAFSAATRVQSRRVELAAQAANSYIDGVRAGTIEAPPINAIAAPPGTAIVAPVASNLDCDANSYCRAPAATAQYRLYCVDLDGNGACKTGNADDINDLIVQAGGVQRQRTPAVAVNDRADLGYWLSVRVYRADAFGTGLTLKTTPANQQNSQKVGTVTSGRGNRVFPTVEMATEIASDETQYSDLCDRIGGC